MMLLPPAVLPSLHVCYDDDDDEEEEEEEEEERGG